MNKTNNTRFVLALIMACWFALLSSFWAYWLALFFAYPFGLISFLMWRKMKSDGKRRNVAIPIILGIGLLISLVMLIFIIR